MSGGWIPVLIVAMVMAMIVLKARYRYLHDQRSADAPQDRADAARLQDEVKQLKERIHVLERIAVEKEDTLSREIDQLRDR
ncbi:MAG: hypothetical protein M3Q83_00550 [Pseudomonadota bacterium]|nr:hypothetical protein [Pseudomonadota bacterium]